MNKFLLKRKIKALLRRFLKGVSQYSTILWIGPLSIRINRSRKICSTIASMNGGWLHGIRKALEIVLTEGLAGIGPYILNVKMQILKQSLEPHFGRHYREVYHSEADFLSHPPGKIGICIRLGQMEILDAMLGSLSDVPFEYDLYIAVPDRKSKSIAKGKLNKLIKIKKLRISIVPDQAKDTVPMLLTFAKSIRNNDFICHIHTTDSSHEVKGQIDWLNHAADYLLGSQKNIINIFKIFEDHPEVGLIYPEPYRDMPYWKYTWLSNTKAAGLLFSRLGMHADFTGYTDFPVGSIFWARVKAIEPLLSTGLADKDFSREMEKADGTFVHTMERSLVHVLRSRGMSFSEINPENNCYRINFGSKNLWQYWNKSSEELCKAMDKFEVISFDIFDTLITRPVLVPDTAFEIVGITINKSLMLKLDYVKCRKQAEFRIRINNDFTGDCSIDDIYEEFRKTTGLSEAQCEAIKKIEIQNEIDLCTPREEMIDIFNYARSKGKRIVLISDIYLRTQDIEAMLSKCGISGYDKILLSSELNKRKDTGELWDYYKHWINTPGCLHIGDNEYSDQCLAAARGLACYHVMSGRNMFYNIHLGNGFHGKFHDGIHSGDSASVGTIISKEFNSPFALHLTDGRYAINSLKKLGYVIFGPIFITFITWLIRNVMNDKRDLLLFLAREGYVFEKFYNTIIKSYGRYNIPFTKIDSRYLLASRRAVSVASIMKEDDILDLIEAPYKGTVSNLLVSRFGITNDNTLDGSESISLPEDYGKVKDIIGLYKGEILRNAKSERDNYISYCRELGLFKYDNIAVVDLGYSGSMQYYLSKIISKPTIGYYFMTRSDTLKGIRYEGNLMKECFSNIDKDANHSINTIYAFILIFEGLLTSPAGQFIKFNYDNDVLKPIFDTPGHSQKVFDSLNQIYEGTLDFMEDMVKYHGNYLLDLTFTQKITQFMLEHIMLEHNTISDEIKSLFAVEDKYCSDGDISVFDYYAKYYGKTG